MNPTFPQDYESLLGLYLKTREAIDGIRQAADHGDDIAFCDECDLPYPDDLWEAACDGCRPETYLCPGCMPEGFGMECGQCRMATCVGCSQVVCQRCEVEGCASCVVSASKRRGASATPPGDTLECLACYSAQRAILKMVRKKKGKASRGRGPTTKPTIGVRHAAKKGVTKARKPAD